MYQLTSTGSLRRLPDGAFIPVDPDNRDYQEFLASGEVPAPWVEPPAPLPTVVSAFQARAALASAGLLGTVNAMMDASTDVQAKLAWEYATELLRTSPTVVAMGAALQLDDAALDALFIAASTITA